MLRAVLNTLGILSIYHRALAIFGERLYGSPSRDLIIIGVTGTKGKSSTTEMIASIMTAAGHTTALLNSIHIQIGIDIQPNTMRMSMPGRMYIPRFLARAKTSGCTVAVLEMTSEGARQHRHRGLALNALVFTNLSPEHIESHGSYEAYANAKFALGESLARSPKRPRIMVANSEDAQSARYLSLAIERPIGFSLTQYAPYQADDRSGYFTFEGVRIDVPQPGEFSLRNAIAAACTARALGVSVSHIAEGLARVTKIAGRAERIEAGQNFTVIVDYAHTPDSLEALYSAYPMRKICVLGSTGGGRDTWKRPVMGGVADSMCDHVILTNEDPYDEDPQTIVDALASGMKRAPEIIMDRRGAIARACALAQPGDAVLITGKGTDPNIAGPNGTKTPWSDAVVAREEILKLKASV